MRPYNKSAEELLNDIEYSCNLMLSQGSSQEEVNKSIRYNTIQLIKEIYSEAYDSGYEEGSFQTAEDLYSKEQFEELEAELSSAEQKINELTMELYDSQDKIDALKKIMIQS